MRDTVSAPGVGAKGTKKHAVTTNPLYLAFLHSAQLCGLPRPDVGMLWARLLCKLALRHGR